MVSSAERGTRIRSYLLQCHKNGGLGDAKNCQIVRGRKRKKPAITLASGCFLPFATGLSQTRGHSHSIINRRKKNK